MSVNRTRNCARVRIKQFRAGSAGCSSTALTSSGTTTEVDITARWCGWPPHGLPFGRGPHTLKKNQFEAGDLATRRKPWSARVTAFLKGQKCGGGPWCLDDR